MATTTGDNVATSGEQELSDVLRIRLDESLRAPGDARRALEPWLHRAGVPAATERAVLLIASELVTNAVTHGRSSPLLVAAAHDGRLRLEVHDDSPEPPAVQGAGGVDGGFGLRLVADAADGWGWGPSGAGKLVWTECHY